MFNLFDLSQILSEDETINFFFVVLDLVMTSHDWSKI